MREFVFQQGTDTWPAGETLWHVYALPDLDHDRELAALVAGCRAAATGFPMTMVDDPWLHITVAQLPDAPGSSTTDAEIDALAGALRTDLAAVTPFTVQVGSCLSYRSGALFDLHPDDGLDQLRDTVAATIGRVRGPDALAYDTAVLHLTLGYADADASSDDLQRRLRRVRPSHAPMTIGAVWLLQVAADPAAKTITWTPPRPHHRIPLAG